MNTELEFFSGTKVIPVLAVEHVESAVPLANALVEGGLTHLEVTLRTPDALEVIKRMAEEVSAAVVGVGSVRNPSDLQHAIEAGAKFAVSPGIEPGLLAAAKTASIPFLPGAATASEVLNLLAQGFYLQKFFPANINGGVAALKAFAGPISQVKFCPTGGVSPDNMKDYLSLSNVFCVGGSWMVPKEKINSRDWQGITELARQAVSLAKLD